MSVKHVKQYYDTVVSDYMEMKKTLESMKDLLNANQSINLPNIEQVRDMVNKLKENYMRISYIIYLLNMPNKKEKKKSYVKQHKNKIDKIPPKHTLDGVNKENQENLANIKNFLK